MKPVKSTDPRKTIVTAALKKISGCSKVTNVKENPLTGEFSGDCMVKNEGGRGGRWTPKGVFVVKLLGGGITEPKPSEGYQTAVQLSRVPMKFRVGDLVRCRWVGPNPKNQQGPPLFVTGFTAQGHMALGRHVDANPVLNMRAEDAELVRPAFVVWTSYQKTSLSDGFKLVKVTPNVKGFQATDLWHECDTHEQIEQWCYDLNSKAGITEWMVDAAVSSSMPGMMDFDALMDRKRAKAAK